MRTRGIEVDRADLIANLAVNCHGEPVILPGKRLF
jgi:hypothetical protein